MALIAAADINAAIDNASTLKRPQVIKMVVHGSSSALLYIQANNAFAGNAGYLYVATAAGTVAVAGSVSAACATRL